MDAVEYINECTRMCSAHTCNSDCPAFDNGCKIAVTDKVGVMGPAEEKVAILEKWVEDNPKRTRQSEFLKIYPKTKRYDNGALLVCPAQLLGVAPYHKGAGCLVRCSDCCAEFWFEEIE